MTDHSFFNATNRLEPIAPQIFHLAECPVWNMAEQSLYWTDILNGEIWRYPVNTGRVELFWKGGMQTGGFAFTKKGEIILCSDQGVFLLRKAPGRERKPELLFEIPFDYGERFNDITTDPGGRILAGTKREDLKNGKLYLLERGKKPEILIEGIGISNGMTFSLDCQWFYHTDSLTCTITRYAYDRVNGKISNPEIFYRGSPSDGFPDGITLDSGGFMWVAFWGASCVRRLSPEGQAVQELRVPAIQPSSVMFGGEMLDTLFITSACEGGTDIQKGLNAAGEFLGGQVYKIRLNVKGRPEWPAFV